MGSRETDVSQVIEKSRNQEGRRERKGMEKESRCVVYLHQLHKRM